MAVALFVVSAVLSAALLVVSIGEGDAGTAVIAAAGVGASVVCAGYCRRKGI